jgi:hypothetical protein
MRLVELQQQAGNARQLAVAALAANPISSMTPRNSAVPSRMVPPTISAKATTCR